MKDTRLYAKFAQDFPSDPKIQPLSDAAFRCWVEAICWSRQHMTDGLLPNRLALARWSLESLTELCTNDPQNPSLCETENGWFIHDYAEHQDTKADMLARQEQAKEAGRRGGLAKAKRTAKRTAKQKASEPLSENVAEETFVSPNGLTHSEVKQGGREPPNTNGTTATAAAPTPCPKHPEGWDHDDPCRRCQRLREHAEQQAIAAKQRANQQRRKAIAACDRCDHNGMAETPAGLTRCTHEPAEEPAW